MSKVVGSPEQTSEHQREYRAHASSAPGIAYRLTVPVLPKPFDAGKQAREAVYMFLRSMLNNALRLTSCFYDYLLMLNQRSLELARHHVKVVDYSVCAIHIALR